MRYILRDSACVGKRTESCHYLGVFFMNMTIENITIRPVTDEEWEDAMGLAWRTFLKFEGSDYTREGIGNFQDFITDQALRRMFLQGEYIVYGAFYCGKIVGIISLRNKEHISLLFVDEEFHKMGIGRKLVYELQKLEKKMGGYRLTVDASPYAVGFYHKVGFVDTNLEQAKDGIRYTPMSWIF
jgi:ribosomal protein S18 acetylase RimI-like enzyme